MQISLASLGRKLVFLGAVALLAALFAGETLRIALAQTWGESEQVRTVARAVALDPGNPELHYRLALLNLQQGEVSPALIALRRAIELNPRPARYWLALGQTCIVLGDQSCAAEGFERATQQAPMMASMEWAAVSYFSGTGDTSRMYSHARRLLELSPESAYEVFEVFSRSSGDSATVWAQVVRGAHHGSVRCVYLDFLAGSGEFDLAAQYWNETALLLVPGKSQLRFADIRPYLQHLIESGRYSNAVSVWRDLLRVRAIEINNSTAADSLIFNGGFEQPILNGGFDWQTHEQPYVALTLSEAATEQGSGCRQRALRIDFTAPHNAEDEPIFQLVPVQPNQSYELMARLRSEAITSDSGPRVRVLDPQCPACLDVAAETTVGTTAWHEVRLPFVTSPQTQVVRVSLWRPRSRVFPMEITGSFWIDSVSLKAGRPVLQSDGVISSPGH